MSRHDFDQKFIELLEAQGVSTPIAKEVSASRYTGITKLLYIFAQTVCSLGLIIIPLILVLYIAENNQNQLTARHQHEAEYALLLRTGVGFSVLVFVFAWICLVGVIIPMVSRLLPLGARVTSFVSALNTGGYEGPFALARLQHALRNHPNPASANELVDAWTLRYASAFLKPALPLLALGFAFYGLESHSWAFATRSALHENPVSPFRSTVEIQWTDIETVELGCNHTRSGNDLIYIVQAGKRSARLSSFETLDDDSELNALLLIDSQIRLGPAQFRRWSWLSRDPLNPRCLEHYRQTLRPSDYEKLEALLRVGAFPGDRR